MSFDPKCMIFDILDAIGVIELLHDVVVCCYGIGIMYWDAFWCYLCMGS